MTGRLTIDGRDAYTDFGIVLCDAKGIAEYPPLKTDSIETTEWPDEDGEDVDLSRAVLDAHTFDMSFICLNFALFDGLYSLLENGACHTFDFEELGVTLRLRMVDTESYWRVRNRGQFTLRFTDDEPLEGFSHTAPGLYAPDYGLSVDGVGIHRYGIIPTGETMHSIRKMPPVKEALAVNVKGSAGQVYDAMATVRYRAKDITLNLVLKCEKSVFWDHYSGFLYDISRPGPHVLRTNAQDEGLPFYYKRASVSRFIVTSTEFCVVFDVVLRVMKQTRVSPYLSIYPSIIWVVPEFSRNVDVESNTDWAVD